MFRHFLRYCYRMQGDYSVERLTALRKEIHENPEGGFKEFQTKRRIIQFLTSIGIKRQTIRELAITGMIVDIPGKKPAEGERKIVAVRADMDALSMTENNPHLVYKSKNQGYAHMCGHDGHIVSLLSFAWKYLSVLDQVPENKIVRLLFQPCEEGPESGAKLMIQEGALEGVNEIYGYHNWPTELPGKIFIKEGPIMSECVSLEIKVFGTKGHGSTPELVKDAVKAGVRIYKTIQEVKQELNQKKLNFVCTIPVIRGGQRYNVFSEECRVQGTIRTYEKGLSDVIISKINSVIKQLQEEGFKVEFKPHYYAPALFNAKTEAGHIERIAKIVYGQENVSVGVLPVRASEDFSYYVQKIPGAFFFATSGRFQTNNPMLHSNTYDFNDDVTDKVGQLWVQLALDRLNSQ